MEGISALWRISTVRMLYSTLKESKTPDPLCEIRVFVFLKERPNHVQYNLIKERLGNKIPEIVRIIFKYPIEKASLTWEDKEEIHSISVRKREGKVKVEIDGMEIEKIDIDEAEKYFGTFQKKITLGKIYRYVAFFNPDGSIKSNGEYDEEAIEQMQTEADMLDYEAE
jgi:hypothetical protein